MTAMWTVARNARDANATKHDWAFVGARLLACVAPHSADWQWVDTILMRTGCV